MVMSVLSLFGGLALFIYGMTNMGTGLQKIAGDRMRSILSALTSNPILGVLLGTVVTAIIQSSSATSVMVIGFVNAGLMTLKQAVAVIIGANIGTTVTAQLIAFDLGDYYLPILAFGFLIYFIAKKNTLKYTGFVFFSFGLLFMGMEIMSSSMAPLRDSAMFQDFIIRFGGHSILILLIGMLITFVVQSSSATIGILIAMSSQGLIGLEVALPAMLGMNIGTCITAMLASIGTKLNARKAALSHVLFNVIGAVLCMFFLPYFEVLVETLSPGADMARQIANAHTIFNCISTIILLPFINQFVALVNRIMPGEERVIVKGPLYLNNKSITTPSIAISLAKKELTRMGELATENFENAMQAFFQKDKEQIEDVMEKEDVIDSLETAINTYLSKVAQQGLTDHDSAIVTGLIQATHDFERVSDHSTNICELAQTSMDENLYFSSLALEELRTMAALTSDILYSAIEGLKKGDIMYAKRILAQENAIDDMEKILRKSHITRLSDGKCIPASGIVFLDMIGNLERVGDHANNIARVIQQDL